GSKHTTSPGGHHPMSDASEIFREVYTDEQRRGQVFGMAHAAFDDDNRDDDEGDDRVLRRARADSEDEDEDDAENNGEGAIRQMCVDCGETSTVRPPRGHSFVEDDGETDAPTARWHCGDCGAQNTLGIRKGQVRSVEQSSASEAFREAYDEDRPRSSAAGLDAVETFRQGYGG